MPLPHWIFSWQTLLIAIGLIIGVQHNFRNPSWLILVLIGTIFLLGDLFPAFPMRYYAFPIALIVIGLWIIFNPNRVGNRKSVVGAEHENGNAGYSRDEYLDSVSFFGGVRKVILSKDFKGGDVTSIFGGTELDLSQADINGRIVLDVTQVLGGTKLIVPPHWDIKSELVSVFGGIADKRNIQSVTINPDKILILKGTSVFGGIDIRSY
jgi:predicted membrane protein